MVRENYKISQSINQVALESSHMYSFTYGLCQFLCCDSRDQMAYKGWCICHLPLSRKALLTLPAGM